MSTNEQSVPDAAEFPDFEMADVDLVNDDDLAKRLAFAYTIGLAFREEGVNPDEVDIDPVFKFAIKLKVQNWIALGALTGSFVISFEENGDIRARLANKREKSILKEMIAEYDPNAEAADDSESVDIAQSEPGPVQPQRRKRSSQTTPEERNQICVEAVSGLTLTRVAANHNLSLTRIRQIIKAGGKLRFLRHA
jgi:hypothetical protein